MATHSSIGFLGVKLVFKAQMQQLLARVGLYQRVKGSRLYDLYWKFADDSVLQDRDREIEFYRALLKGFRQGDVIFDIGANKGSKVDIFLRLGARVVAVEPDRSNQLVLRQRFLEHRLHTKPVSIVEQAVSNTESVETMWIDGPGSAKNTLSRKWVETLKNDEQRFGHRLDFQGQQLVETITLERLIAKCGAPFFVKVDVEGNEPRVLKGLTQAVPFLSYEVNLPEFRKEGLECVDLLARLDRDGRFNYAAECGRGLLLDRWLEPIEFSRVLEACTETSIEVFWKAPCAKRTGE